MKIVKLIFCVIFTLCLNVFGQEKDFVIESISVEDFEIPLIKSLKQPEIAYKINKRIQDIYFSSSEEYKGKVIQSPNKIRNLIIKDLKYTSGESGGNYLNLRFNISGFSKSMLVIHFFSENYGARIVINQYSLNFNLQTGNEFDMFDLFSKQGIEHLNNLATRLYKYEIDKGIIDNYYNPEQLIDLNICNEREIESIELGFSEFRISKGRCFSAADRASDPFSVELYNIFIRINDLFFSNFTPLGKTFLQEMIISKSLNFTKESNKIQIKGKVDNKYPFQMVLWLYTNDDIDGLYWYTKEGTLIDFYGRKTSKNKIELIEKGGKFDITINNNGKLSGKWFNKKGKSFPIKFE